MYRSVILRPTERSLHARRMLHEAIQHWAEPASNHGSNVRDDINDQIERSEPPDHSDSIPGDEVNDPSAMPQPMGVRNAWQALNVALHSRMRKELSRLKLEAGRKTA